MNLKQEELEKLGRFQIRDRYPRDDEIFLEGVFTPGLDPSLGWCKLYAIPTLGDIFVDVLWEAADKSSSILNFSAHWDIDELAVGNALYYGTLDLKVLLLILDLDTPWVERVFHAADAWSCDGPEGWRTTLQPHALPPPDAKNVKLRPKAWDHEHCVFTSCYGTISEHQNTNAFVGLSCFGTEMWVCRECYETKVLPHAL